MVHESQATIILVLAKLVYVVKVDGNRFVSAINHHENLFGLPINEFNLQRTVSCRRQKDTYSAGMVTNST